MNDDIWRDIMEHESKELILILAEMCEKYIIHGKEEDSNDSSTK